MDNGLTLTLQNGISQGHKYRFTSSLVTGNCLHLFQYRSDLNPIPNKAMSGLDCIYSNDLAKINALFSQHKVIFELARRYATFVCSLDVEMFFSRLDVEI